MPSECGILYACPLPGEEQLWPVWKSVNRLQAGIGRCKDNPRKLGLTTKYMLYECGEEQTISHMLQCKLRPSIFTKRTSCWQGKMP